MAPWEGEEEKEEEEEKWWTHLDKGDGFVGLEVVVREKVVARLARIGHANRGCKREWESKMVSGWVGGEWR